MSVQLMKERWNEAKKVVLIGMPKIERRWLCMPKIERRWLCMRKIEEMRLMGEDPGDEAWWRRNSLKSRGKSQRCRVCVMMVQTMMEPQKKRSLEIDKSNSSKRRRKDDEEAQRKADHQINLRKRFPWLRHYLDNCLSSVGSC